MDPLAWGSRRHRFARRLRETLLGRERDFRPEMVGAEKDALRVLTVLHDAPGGVDRTSRDLLAALGTRVDASVLRADPFRMVLEGSDTKGRAVDRAFHHRRPWQATDHRRADFRELYRGVLDATRPNAVHLRHLLAHTFDLLDLCAERGVRVVVSAHDHYLVCPGVVLLDDQGRDCGGQCTEGRGQCQLPLPWLEGLPVLKSGYRKRWLTEVEEALGEVSAVVVTSQSSREILARSLPSLAERIHQIPHGRDLERRDLAVPPSAGEATRILTLGKLDRHKGSRELAAVLEASLTQGPSIVLHHLGPPCPELRPYAPRGVLVEHGPYSPAALPSLVEQIRPSLAILLPIWSETWSHTLTEALALGLPVIGSDRGAVGERLVETGGGWAVPADAPEVVLRRIEGLAVDLGAWGRAVDLVRQVDLGSCSSMAERYFTLLSGAKRLE